MKESAKPNKNITSNIVLSNTYLSGFYEIINEIKTQTQNDKFENIILVVPDKFSLNAEQIFMEKIGFSSIFNVWLTTWSRLISKVVGDDDKNFTLLSKNSGTMLVSEIILKNMDKISTYKKIANSYVLAETMFNIINLLKSSGVKPVELKQNFDDTTFGLKLKDIYLIYSEYEKAMANKTDSITRLEIFDKKIKHNEYVKNSKIYFSMFDSFTNVQMASLANLAKTCKSFCISLCANTVQNNHYIYDNSVFQKLKNNFDEAYVEYNIKNITANQNARNSFLTKNLLSYSPNEKYETKDIKLLECDSIGDEIKYVASKIKYLVMEKGYQFDEINVAINGLNDYELELTKTFNEFDLPHYVDASKNMLEHYFCSSIFKVALFACGDKTMSNAISIVKSPLFLIDEYKKCDFDNFCKKNNIFGDMLYGNFNVIDDMSQNAEEVRHLVFDEIKTFEQNLNDSKDVLEYTTCLKTYIEKINSKEVIQKNIEKQNDIILKQLDSQVLEKFYNLLDEAVNMLGCDEISKDLYFDILKSGLKGVNLLSAPIRCNAVFVGDASQSTYYPRKILFVLGSSDARMPQYRADDGTITDTEIDIFKANSHISPTIKELNKREKFKLFNLLLLPSDKLELTYSTMINGQAQQKSEFITSIQNIITVDGFSIKIEQYALQELKIFESTGKNLPAYMVGTLKNAIEIAKGKDDNLKYVLKSEFDDIITFESNKYKDKEDRFNLTDTKKYLFTNKKTSISQIEKYFSCPFYQFIEKGISPKEAEDASLKPLVVGNILHKVAQYFVDELIKKNCENSEIEKLATRCFDKTLMLDDFKNYSTKSYLIQILKDEAVRFCRAIKHQIDCSDFKPFKTEMHFENADISNGLSISGYIDRVDQYANYIKVVDYKTGSQLFSYEDVYYGIKLQLLAYSKIVANILKKESVCTAYMPVKNTFADITDAEFKGYKLDGIFLDDDGIKVHLDNNLIDNKKSEIVNLSKNYCLNREEFKSLFDYTFKIIDGAIGEMLDGYISPKPYVNGQKNSCKYCKYKTLCHHLIERDGYRKIDKKQKNSFDKGN